MQPASRLPLLLVALVAACGRSGEPRAVAELAPLGDSDILGTATFTAIGDGKVRVDADISGLAPGTHGFHIHEFGDCSDAEGKSAGGHFNPDHHAHSGPGPHGHAGDLGNIEADAGGEAHVSVTLDQISVDTGKHGILGRSLIVHEKADDLASQPAGDAGGRIACAFIRSESGTTKPVKPQS